MKPKTFYKVSLRNDSKPQASDEGGQGEGSCFGSCLESERPLSMRSSFKPSSFASVELEIRKVLPNTVINFQEDLKSTISSLVARILSGEFPCKNCQERLETIKKLTNDIELQNIATFDEIDKLKEMKLQVMKHENFLKTKEKNLELQSANLTENTEIMKIKNQMIEKNLQTLKAEKDKIIEERKKLEEEKKIFNKKFKKLDEQFFCINREMTQRDHKDAYETNTHTKLELAGKSEDLSQISSEIQLNHQTILEFIEKFTDMKAKFEQNQKNFEKLIKEKASKSEEKDSKSHQKIKKIKQKLKEMELKVKDLVMKNLDLSLIRTEEVTEKFITKPEPDFEDKDLIIKKNPDYANQEESKIKLQEAELQEKSKNLRIKEKELKLMQDQISKEKENIAKTAQYLQDIFLQLEIQRQSLGLEKQTVQNEKEASHNAARPQKKPFKSFSTFPALPDLANRQSLHFTDEEIVIKINDKKA